MSESMGNRRDNFAPDFIIAGAMKSGTTSMYSILRQHPDLFMPPLEIGFFDIDDIRQHPDFFKLYNGQWHFHPYNDDELGLRDWYRSLFEDAGPGQIVGERSTSYMASSLAPRRIHDVAPNVKIIFMLRDPVHRAYSNYWHLLRSGEATDSFENTLRYRPTVLFDRGLYREQIERYLEYFRREQLLFLVFEEYVSEQAEALATVCEFIGVEPDCLLKESRRRHENRGRYPWSRHLQYAVNWLVFHGLLDGQRYIDSHLPALQTEEMGYSLPASWAFEALTFTFKAVSRVNCSRRKRPELQVESRKPLKYLYEEHNAGLSELIDKDLTELWPVTKV